ncbi:hypothetical protein SAMN06265355_109130 [Actinomadura mexicana]|uniref:Uncharacterized protein n=2 Tax=Actinomadura mexicana TaxID=134959 RepID=A0A239AQ10_9ACTN|nr:hypothetical protein SAMN06265355_109130 [Actinomadura mexicana]
MVLGWRTCKGHDVAVGNLQRLRGPLGAMGWRCVGLYDKEEFRFPVSLLWVYAGGAAGDIGAVLTARALPGGTWGYFEAGDGRGGFVSLCRDTESAAERLDLLLKNRIFPGTEWAGSRDGARGRQGA